MKVMVLKAREYKVHKANLVEWVHIICSELQQLKQLTSLLKQNLNIIFVTPIEMQDLNQKFRNKKGVTDILSFAPSEPNSLGELVICFSVLCKKKNQELSEKQWLYYLILHGILHLLGFEHEADKKAAQIMYSLQDKVFAKCIKQIKNNHIIKGES